MNIEFRNGLLFTTLEITYNDMSKVLGNIVIDTGASRTLLSQEAVDDLGIRVSGNDEIVTLYGIGGKEHAFVKKVDKITIGNNSICNSKIDFKIIEYDDINGLLGLDILIDAGYILDLKNFRLYQDKLVGDKVLNEE